MAVQSPRWGPPAFYDRRRTKEFHKYYEPIRAALSAEPAWTDLHDDEAVARHKPVSSPDKALTAFCQLTAVKLNVRRGMLFLFDAERGYVLAEATQSLSLRNDAHKSEGDDLWLGHTIIPRGFSVCEHTVNLPANAGSNGRSSTASIVHVINDLSGDVRFCNRPFVTDGPRARFYAGVPITTAEGVNIGALCALDDKPREGASEAEVELLVDMAAAVMSHLEALRAKAEFQRGNTMLASLTTFLDDMNAFRDGNGPPDAVAPSLPVQTHSQSDEPLHQPRDELDGTDQVLDPSNDTVQPSAAASGEGVMLSVVDFAGVDHNDASIRAGFAAKSILDPADINNSQNDVKHVYQHAAAILQRAMDVDGVVFLDVSSTKLDTVHDGLGQPRHVTYPTSSGTNTANEDVVLPPTPEQARNPGAVKDDVCAVLAAAPPSTHAAQSSLRIQRQLMKSLVRRYEYGKIWRLSQDDDGTSDEPSNSSSSQQSAKQDQGRAGDESRRRHRLKDMSSIHTVIPEAQSIIFLPIWNHSSGRWCAGVIAYTKSPLRSFFEDTELLFMRAFCDVAMAELDRLNTSSMLRTKSTFVSSISHELRTPLHGILGMVEHLKEQVSEQATKDMVAQIETCGQTMLEIVNHILDLSHINQIVRRPQSSSEDDSEAPKSQHSGKGFAPRPQTVLRPSAKLALDTVSESVIESAIYSFYSRHSQQRQSSARVTTILDIDRRPSIDWTCKLGIGAWKRICINLIINALKHTAHGHVHISLKQAPPSTLGDDTTAVLTVTDTGCGMSQDFMQSSLFKPFEQEDGLSDGAGLGMSLVVKILKAINGRINVKSLRGSGTTVTVSIPLSRRRKHAAQAPKESIDGINAGHKHAVAVDFIGESWDVSANAYGRGRQILQSSLRQSIEGLLARSIVRSDTETTTHLNIVAEEDLPRLKSLITDQSQLSNPCTADTPLGRPLIVVCRTYQTMRQCRLAVQALRETTMVHTEFITEPCGILQVATSLQACLRSAGCTLDLPSSMLSRLNLTERAKRAPRPGLGSRQSSAKSVKAAHSRTSTSDLPPQTPTPPSNHENAKRAAREDALAGTTPVPISAETVLDACQPREVLSSSLRFPPTPALTPTETFLANPVSDVSVLPAARTEPHSRDTRPPSEPNLCLLLVDDNDINMRLMTLYADRQRHGKLTAENGLQAVKLNREALSAGSARPQQQPDQHIAAEPKDDSQVEAKSTDRIDEFQPTESQPESTSTSVLPSRWPQVTLMDINMPIMDGFEATRQIRKAEAEAGRQRRTYIIAMTGLGSEDAQREAIASGIDLFLTKPVRLKELNKIIEAKPWVRRQ